MNRVCLFRFRSAIAPAVLTIACAVLCAPAASAQPKTLPLDAVSGLTLHNVAAEAATLEGKKGVRVTINAAGDAQQIEPLAIVDGLEFGNGVIEAEVAGAPAPGAGEGARGFVGIAFRLQKDRRTYDAFYLRPTNGRAEDQERRNHVAQYIAHPDWTWFRLRKETPSRYESYVDMLPNTWTPIRIEVRGDKARLFVNNQPQPVLIVNDVKSGAQATGGIALWIGPGTIGHFRNLRVERQ